ncbi:prophage side tail fiber protein homolog StfR-like isoform X2 [Macrobrachium rosenbergii]|uniref:prophage side tail fiber protein homolog StfR-like isoform X2 n=1 Tax=Macrobrachium rosenbergii TaxID=79674 RepID=UPI0034D4938E
MKGLIIVFAAIVAVSLGAPTNTFTAREYEALQQALGNRIPVGIQSAIRILAAEETNPTDFVVLNFDGLRGGGPSLRTSAGVVDSALSARTGAVSDDDVAETFSEVAGDAVDDVKDTAEEAAQEAEVEAVNRTAVTEDNTNTVTDNAATRTTAEDIQETAENTPEAASPGTEAAVPTATTAVATEASAVSRSGLAADAGEAAAPAAAAAAVAAAAAAEQAASQVSPSLIAAQLQSARRKRQNDQNDVNNEYATTLSFALQFLGLELVPVNEN